MKCEDFSTLRHLTPFLLLVAFGVCCTSRAHAQNTTPAAPQAASATAEPSLPNVDEYMKNKSATDLVIGTRAGTQTSDVKGGSADGKVLNGSAESLPQPAYPPAAKAVRAQGTVAVMVVVDEQGKIVAAQVLSGHPLLRSTCLEAARSARFTPTRLEGKPVKVSGVINYNFSLQ